MRKQKIDRTRAETRHEPKQNADGHINKDAKPGSSAVRTDCDLC